MKLLSLKSLETQQRADDVTIGERIMILSLLLVGALVAVTRQSLWIDEATVAWRAMEPTLGDCWRCLTQHRTSELQMPLYMAFMWVYEKIFDTGEWTLRAANVPWFVFGAFAFIQSLPGIGRRRCLTFVVLFCPFAWYYLNEARPYAMQMAASLMIAGALVGIHRAKANPEKVARVDQGLFCFGVLVLSGSSLLGMMWASAAFGLLITLTSVRGMIRLVKDRPGLWSVSGGILIFFAIYYLWTLRLGARATLIAPSLSSFLFIPYELMGFSGLGPGRLELRSTGLAAVAQYSFLLMFYAAAVTVVLIAAIRSEVRLGSRLWLMVVLWCAVPAIFILATGVMQQFRVLGRHFTPLIPVVLLVLSAGLDNLSKTPRNWAKACIAVFCLLALYSCINLRWAHRHEKDDYRSAAQIVRSARDDGLRVWWNAAESGAAYYHVPVSRTAADPTHCYLLENPSSGELRELPAPDLIMASRADVYDGQNAVAQYVQQHGYHRRQTFPGFALWEKHGR